MNKKFVRVLADINCDWEGLNPIYRVYVNKELFAERTWSWTNSYIQEMLQIEADSGCYELNWELVPPHLAKLSVSNVHVDFGPATVENNRLLRIHDES
jgi:hypothetical protein